MTESPAGLTVVDPASARADPPPTAIAAVAQLTATNDTRAKDSLLNITHSSEIPGDSHR
ncbi:hypothetical protein [Nocardia terpenica]|uniref:hypothetical protein n=1 Tax=Nocardia terpenica TaxID=455432 RepID=UPI0012FE47BB|nr:hypothetical protein [Nocardia terpenica]